jgi:beta-aspartyl-peptidase (threonine type)
MDKPVSFLSSLRHNVLCPLTFRPEPHDTVGAAAVDSAGMVACATSTGGITMKRPGRVGDSPLVGSGGYADNALGACSATGHGESLGKFVASYRALALLPTVQNPTAAIHTTLDAMLRRVGGRGGLIMVTPDGRVGHGTTTTRMVWASCRGGAGQVAPDEVKDGFHSERLRTSSHL